MRTKILYEDGEICVIQKPAGLATQTGAVGQKDVVSELKNYLATEKKQKNPPYLGVVHRLDQPVEGILVFAKNAKAAANLTRQLSAETLHKHYYAAIYGTFEKDQGELTDTMIKEGSLAKIVTEEKEGDPKAKVARLKYHIIGQPYQHYEGKEMTEKQKIFLAEIEISTGRFHQIRAQMAHAGMPLLGDSKYGTEESIALSRTLGVRNVALCAYRISFQHPLSGEEMSFQIEPQGEIFAGIATM